MGLFSKLLCTLSIHGPEHFGAGTYLNQFRNERTWLNRRRCNACGAEWVGIEARENGRPVLLWRRAEQMNTKRN